MTVPQHRQTDLESALGGVPAIRSVGTEERRLVVIWQDRARSVFPFIWLRDNCACPACRHPGNGQRLLDVLDIPADIAAHEVSLLPTGEVAIRWKPDGHASRYAAAWLAGHEFSPEARAGRRPHPRLWGAEMANDPPSAEWAAFERSPAAERRGLELLHDYGFLVLHDVPVESGMVVRVGDRLGHVRVTNYGRCFDVISVPNPNNLAYTAIALGVHTDNPYRDPTPGLQLLHCLEAGAPGGDSLLVDGFAAAEALRRADRAAFDLLARLPLPFRFADKDADLQARTPVISVDFDGEVTGVHLNSRSMAPLDAPEELVETWNAAYRAFVALLHRSAGELRLRLAPGDLLIMENNRVLHGRDAFDPNAGCRHLQGCYVDKDGVDSRRRVLSRESGATTAGTEPRGPAWPSPAR